MTARFKEACDRGAVQTVRMIEIDHPAGYGYFWDSVGKLDYGGNTYEGYGTVGAVTEIGTTTEIEIPEIRFACAGVDTDLLEGLDDSVKGRLAYVYEGLLDDHHRVVERELLTTAQLDYQEYEVGADGKSVITLVAHGGLFFLRRRSAAKWSPQEAKALYPDETGFDEVHLQEDLQDQWKPS